VIDEQTTAKFLRGLTLGAIIGAVVAGSSFWTRRRRTVSRSETLPAKTGDAASRDTRDAG
jgi:hypothetical protein